MPSPRLLLLPVALLLAALLPAAPVSAKTTALSGNLRGLQIAGIGAGAERIDADLASAQRLGAKVVRTDLRWDVLEADQGSYDEGYLAQGDHLFAEARKRGIRVYLTMQGTPCWASTEPGRAADCSGDNDYAAYPPSDDGAFARAAAAVAGRWQKDLVALEVWNEPDQRNELYWKGADKAPKYAALLKAAYPAIKAAAPSVKVAAPGIVGSNGKFLQALYAEGIKGSYDVLSVHYYDLVLLSLGQIRQVRKAAGDKTPMWLAEYGWTSCLSKTTRSQDQHACVTPGTQAQNTLDALRALRKLKDVQGAILYTLHDDPSYDFGAVDIRGHAKPLFTALSRAYRGNLGRDRAITLHLRARGGQVVASGSGPAGDAFVMTASVGGKLRWQAAFREDRYNRYSVKLPSQLGTHGITVRVRRYTVAGRTAVRAI